MTVPQAEQITESIMDFLKNNFPLARREPVELEEKLLDSGIVDSLGLLTIINFLESTFDIIINDTEVVTENFESVGKITQFVLKKRPKASHAD